MKRQEVWTLRYSHRHGTDVSVYAVKEAALRAAIDIIIQYNGEIHIPRVREEILGMISRGEFRNALDAWDRYQQSRMGDVEDLIIDNSIMATLKDYPKRSLTKGAKAELEEFLKPEETCPVENCGLKVMANDGTCGQHGDAVEFERES